MRRIFASVIQDFKAGENIDLYLIVLVAIPLIVLNILGKALDSTGAAILAVLVVLAIAMLVNRKKLEVIGNEIQNEHGYSVLRKGLPENWIDDLKNANELWIFGINLARTITTFYPIIEEKVLRGTKIKIMIVNPHGESQKILTKRLFRSVSPDSNKPIILSSLADLCRLKEKRQENVEIKTIDYVLPFGVFGMNLNSHDGIIYIENYPFKSKSDDAPVLIFHKSNIYEQYWYDFYHHQIQQFWESSLPWASETKNPETS